MNIAPTVGRKVWYYQTAAQIEPWDATVTRVFEETEGSPASVNLAINEPDGGARYASRVVEGAEDTVGECWRWMPYQVGQAKAEPRLTTADMLDIAENLWARKIAEYEAKKVAHPESDPLKPTYKKPKA